MAQHYKIDCDKVEDRKELAVILVMNGYTVRMEGGNPVQRIENIT